MTDTNKNFQAAEVSFLAFLELWPVMILTSDGKEKNWGVLGV
jgi:hypothetical protein